jgi:hypothetical protein
VIKEIELAKLVEDYEIYPRTQVHDLLVRQLAEALEMGEALPPIIVEAKTFRIVDGFHRSRAHRKAGLVTIRADVRTFKTEADLYKAAVAPNTQHGRRLAPFEYGRVISKGMEFGLSDTDIAGLLRIAVPKVDEIRRGFARTNGHQVPLKRGLGHLAQKKLTEPQKQLNEHWGGMKASFYAGQLLQLVRAEAVDPQDETLSQRMNELCELWMATVG